MSTNEKRILIVDDDDAIRALLFTILRHRGFAVDGASNGIEALVRLRRCVYAAMLLDLMMPLKSGYEVLDELKELPADARPIVFVLTAGNEPRDLDPALVAGSIRKPFDVDVLLDMITACVSVLTPRPQLPDCPPADRAAARDKVN
ncbi:MAG: response regulator [Acidobacteriota bacterium]|nr:response regulator [Acidobacteriota bacterium]